MCIKSAAADGTAPVIIITMTPYSVQYNSTSTRVISFVTIDQISQTTQCTCPIYHNDHLEQ